MPIKIVVTIIAPDLPEWATDHVVGLFDGGDEGKAMQFLAGWIEDRTIISSNFELTDADEAEAAGSES